ncbi:hypothetical protein KIPB_004730, partial [Kipferlia bialata]
DYSPIVIGVTMGGFGLAAYMTLALSLSVPLLATVRLTHMGHHAAFLGVVLLCMSLCRAYADPIGGGSPFVCPAPEHPDFYGDPSQYVCPPGVEGGFPLEWLSAVNNATVPVSFQNNPKMAILRSFFPTKTNRLSYYLDYTDSQNPSQEQILHKEGAFFYWASWISPVLVCLVTIGFILRLCQYTMSSDVGEMHWPLCIRCPCCDLTGRYGIDVTDLRALDQEQSHNQCDTFTNKDHTYVGVYNRQTYVGGFVTCCFVTVFVCSLFSLAILVVSIPPVNLPSDISGELYPDGLVERTVSSVPYTSLFDAEILRDWLLQRDNMYVTEIIGGDWGTTCIDASLLEGLSFWDKVQMVPSAASGAIPPQVQPDSPTTTTVLQESGAIQFETENCFLMGGTAPCSETFSNPDIFDPISNPVVQYGCFIDEQGMYHHLTLVTMLLVSQVPQGMDPVYTVKYTPTREFPQFGTNVAAVKEYVLPSMFNVYAMGTRDQIQWVDRSMASDETYPYIVCSWIEVLGYQDKGDEFVDWEWYDKCFLGFEAHPGMVRAWYLLMGEPVDDMNDLIPFDVTRVASVGVGPLPHISAFDNPGKQCRLVCTRVGTKCFYEGQMCAALATGVPNVGDYYHDEPWVPYSSHVSQPTGVLCPDVQPFRVRSQIGYSMGWDLTNVSANEDADHAITHYATVYDTISSQGFSVCPEGTQATRQDPLSVSVVREFAAEVVMIDFSVPSILDIAEVYLLLLVSLLMCHWMVMWVVSVVHFQKKHSRVPAVDTVTAPEGSESGDDSDTHAEESSVDASFSLVSSDCGSMDRQEVCVVDVHTEEAEVESSDADERQPLLG